MKENTIQATDSLIATAPSPLHLPAQPSVQIQSLEGFSPKDNELVSSDRFVPLRPTFRIHKASFFNNDLLISDAFAIPKDWTGLDFTSIIDEAEKIRNIGSRLFKEGKFELAKAKYDKVLREFNHVNPQDDEEGKTFSNTRNLLHLNVAACYLKMGECRKSIETCNKVIEANPRHVKALYRHGMAFMAAGDFEEAKSDFNKMIQLDKSMEPDATAALLKVKQQEHI